MTIIRATAPAVVRAVVSPLGGGALPWETQQGGVAPLTPASFTSLFARYRARTGEVTLNSTTVSEWDDLVSDDQSLVQATEANQPTFAATDAHFNGKGSIDLDGTDDFLADSGVDAAFKPLHDGTGGTLVLIFHPQTGGTAGSQIIWNDNSVTAAKVGHGIFRSSTNNTLTAQISNGVAGVFMATSANGSCVIDVTQSAVLRYKEGGIPGLAFECSFRLNGAVVSEADSAAAPSSSNPTEAVHIGRASTGLASLIFSGKLAEICCFNAALTDAEITALSSRYFVPEYGRTI